MADAKTKTTSPAKAEPEALKPDSVIPPGDAVPTTALERYLHSVAAVATEEAEDASDAIINRILEANSIDDVLGGQEVIHARDMLYIPMRVQAVRWNQSDFEGAEQVYALMDAVRLDTGTPLVVTCGGRSVMAQLYKLDELGALPAVLQIVQAQRPTKSGFIPMWLEPATDPNAPEPAFD